MAKLRYSNKQKSGNIKHTKYGGGEKWNRFAESAKKLGRPIVSAKQYIGRKISNKITQPLKHKLKMLSRRVGRYKSKIGMNTEVQKLQKEFKKEAVDKLHADLTEILSKKDFKHDANTLLLQQYLEKSIDPKKDKSLNKLYQYGEAIKAIDSKTEQNFGRRAGALEQILKSANIKKITKDIATGKLTKNKIFIPENDKYKFESTRNGNKDISIKKAQNANQARRDEEAKKIEEANQVRKAREAKEAKKNKDLNLLLLKMEELAANKFNLQQRKEFLSESTA
jgi:hypothetical protein